MSTLRSDTISGHNTDGPVFDGALKYTSENYMTLPKGTTTQSNRGRGLYAGGASAHGSDYTDIVYLNIQSTGNTIQFGDLTTSPRTWIHGMGSATRAIWAGGATSQGSPQTND